MVDARGHRLLPGFNDAHVHFSDGGLALTAVQLNDATSLQEFVKRIAAYAAQQPKGEWIRSGNWDETKWSSAGLPTRQDIDAVTPDNPVSLDRYDGHMILVNSKVLAHRRHHGQDPGSSRRRDRARRRRRSHRRAQGRRHRIGRERGTAADAGAAAPRHRERAARAASHGVTSVQDMSLDYGDLRVYSQLLGKGNSRVRLYGAPPIDKVTDQAKLGHRPCVRR